MSRSDLRNLDIQQDKREAEKRDLDHGLLQRVADLAGDVDVTGGGTGTRLCVARMVRLGVERQQQERDRYQIHDDDDAAGRDGDFASVP